MKLSFHTAQGRLPIEKMYLLGDGWMNTEASWNDVFDLITLYGHATSAELLSDKRDGSQFKSRELIMIDIDNDLTKVDKIMTFEDLAYDPLYSEYGAGYYTTPSHVDDAQPRFRIMYRLETPITDGKRMTDLYCGLLEWYKSADRQCKDPTRLFFGTVNAKYRTKTNKLLPNNVVDEIIKMLPEEVIDESIDRDYKPLEEGDRTRMLEALRTLNLTRDEWVMVGFGLRAEGFSLEDYIWATNEKSYKNAKDVWTSPNKSNKPVTVGSVIYFLKERLGEDCLRPKYKQPDKVKQILQRLKEKQNGY